jgi:hypothetical protein
MKTEGFYDAIFPRGDKRNIHDELWNIYSSIHDILPSGEFFLDFEEGHVIGQLDQGRKDLPILIIDKSEKIKEIIQKDLNCILNEVHDLEERLILSKTKEWEKLKNAN